MKKQNILSIFLLLILLNFSTEIKRTNKHRQHQQKRSKSVLQQLPQQQEQQQQQKVSSPSFYGIFVNSHTLKPMNNEQPNIYNSYKTQLQNHLANKQNQPNFKEQQIDNLQQNTKTNIMNKQLDNNNNLKGNDNNSNFLLNRGFSPVQPSSSRKEDETKEQDKGPNNTFEKECNVQLLEQKLSEYSSSISIDLYSSQCECDIVFLEQQVRSPRYFQKYVDRLAQQLVTAKKITNKHKGQMDQRYKLFVFEQVAVSCQVTCEQAILNMDCNLVNK